MKFALKLTIAMVAGLLFLGIGNCAEGNDEFNSNQINNEASFSHNTAEYTMSAGIAGRYILNFGLRYFLNSQIYIGRASLESDRYAANYVPFIRRMIQQNCFSFGCTTLIVLGYNLMQSNPIDVNTLSPGWRNYIERLDGERAYLFYLLLQHSFQNARQ